jgi:hypothetical protein
MRSVRCLRRVRRTVIDIRVVVIIDGLIHLAIQKEVINHRTTAKARRQAIKKHREKMQKKPEIKPT